MRALLVANPTATTTTARTRDVIVRALGSELKVDVVATAHRGHAAALARQARAEGLHVVVALGGDGTVNEVVNGLLAGGPTEDGPALAVVPGGSTNVFARALGVADDPVEATGQILDAARERRVRRIGLGRAADRWFTSNAGMGLDAEVVADVDHRRGAGVRSTHALYVRTAVRRFFLHTDRRHPALTVTRPDQPVIEPLFLAVIQNTAPWTYLGNRPVDPCPNASFDTGLDLFGLRRFGTATTLRHVAQLLSSPDRAPHGRSVLSLHDQSEITVWASKPVAFQLDGEHLGERGGMTFTAVPRALGVLI